MKRAFAYAGCSALAVLFLLFKLRSVRAIGIAFSASLIALALSVLIKRLRRIVNLPTVLLALSLVLCSFLINETTRLENISKTAGKQAHVTAVLYALPYDTGYGRILPLRIYSVNGESMRLDMRVTSSIPIEIEPTDIIALNITLNEAVSGDSAFENYYLSQGISLKGSLRSKANYAIRKHADSSFSQRLLLFKLRMIQSIMSVTERDSGSVICGLVLGEKSVMSEKITNEFKACGVMHLFAVSGLHIGVWSELVFAVFRKLLKSRKKASVGSIAFCLVFILLTGANPPVVRAGFMMIVLRLSDFVLREPDPYNSMGFALFIMLVFNPYSALSVSLWLSLLSTVGIVCCSQRLDDFNQKITEGVYRIYMPGLLFGSELSELPAKLFAFLARAVCDSVLISVTAAVATAPVFVYVFGEVSVITIISNLVLVSLGSLLMQAGGIAALLMCIGISVPGRVLMTFAGFISKLVLSIAEYLSELPVTLVSVSGTASKAIVIAGAVIIAFMLLIKVKDRKKIIAVSSVLACAFIAVNAYGFVKDYFSPTVYLSPCSGGAGIIVTYRSDSIIIDSALSGADARGLRSVAEEVPVTKVDYFIYSGKPSSALISNPVVNAFKCKNVMTEDTDFPKGFSPDFNAVKTESGKCVIKNDNFMLTCEQNYVTISYEGRLALICLDGTAPDVQADYVLLPSQEKKEISL